MVNKKRHDTNGMHMLQTEARDQENQEKWTAFHQRRTILKARCRHSPAHKRHNRAYSFPDSARNKWPPAAKPTSRKWHPNLPKQQKKRMAHTRSSRTYVYVLACAASQPARTHPPIRPSRSIIWLMPWSHPGQEHPWTQVTEPKSNGSNHLEKCTQKTTNCIRDGFIGR